MQTLERRITHLETASNPRGPLLLSWQLDANSLAMAVRDGQRYSQAAGESRQDFFIRVAATVPNRAFVWVDQLDEKL
jgi:hypothetical protein